MRKIGILFIVLFLSGCSEAGLTGEVTYIVDGDTIDVKLGDGSIERVRFLLIDTPETKHPTIGVQPYGPEASVFTEQLEGETVELELDVAERDRYGRMLAYVWHDGEMFNEKLLEEGLARVSVYPPNTKYVDEFRAVEATAKNDGIGIWSVENYQQDESTVSQDAGCDIKGNINSRGDKIYHTVDSPYYDKTIPEEWFCSVEAAEDAGFRAPK
ncbi:thermonuclease family protein [Jeotgalibacillus haloalkalitolerans]|uniref:Thermonuclease family protein n=1 Tax=Jeotgalibacillus haloalkalitolerans TaxID=3104292 RepID=A0ABU5KL27_9BACL|nr:thermonuclease family protein [Jeotgalibacillus sp. HH7-29]MDZ5711839.1 thermonuclease family protein [Jeotgalibacillus sp. HH7-29]